MKNEGGCFCGAIRYEFDGTPSRITNCHCLHCRRTSGAPYLTWAEVDTGHFRITRGTPGRFESRPNVTRQFCSNCGTQLTYQHVKEADIMDVTVCSLDAPEEMEPEDHVWSDRMLPWIRRVDKLPRYKLSRFADDQSGE